MNLALIDEQIRLHEHHAHKAEEDARYADGGAYSQDRDRAQEHRRTAAQWREIKSTLEQLRA